MAAYRFAMVHPNAGSFGAKVEFGSIFLNFAESGALLCIVLTVLISASCESSSDPPAASTDQKNANRDSTDWHLPSRGFFGR